MLRKLDSNVVFYPTLDEIAIFDTCCEIICALGTRQVDWQHVKYKFKIVST